MYLNMYASGTVFPIHFPPTLPRPLCGRLPSSLVRPVCGRPSHVPPQAPVQAAPVRPALRPQ